ncbi:MAG: hypothetical protein BroJett018_54980 [Chloroflexota bacterium]|nr:MAG: hypothetical protein BroJett018_54980 [Chloroflexota bacterium]
MSKKHSGELEQLKQERDYWREKAKEYKDRSDQLQDELQALRIYEAVAKKALSGKDADFGPYIHRLIEEKRQLANTIEEFAARQGPIDRLLAGEPLIAPPHAEHLFDPIDYEKPSYIPETEFYGDWLFIETKTGNAQRYIFSGHGAGSLEVTLESVKTALRITGQSLQLGDITGEALEGLSDEQFLEIIAPLQGLYWEKVYFDQDDEKRKIYDQRRRQCRKKAIMLASQSGKLDTTDKKKLKNFNDRFNLKCERSFEKMMQRLDVFPKTFIDR